MDPTGTPSTISAAEAEHTSPVKLYLRVFFALLILTVLEYYYAQWFAEASFAVLVGGLMLLAVIKASLVGLFFMHLLFEGRWKYMMLIPTAFLACVAVFALVPDIAMRLAEPADQAEEQLVNAPFENVMDED